jgi:NAD(P)H-quinone oxidoreductase subunit 6
MNLQDLNFLFLSLLTLSSALGVVFLSNLVYSAFLLGVVLVCIAAFFLLLNADFLAAAQILLYVGAINILILFAIMLIQKPSENYSVEQNRSQRTSKVWANFGKGAFSFILFGLLTKAIQDTPWLTPPFFAVTNSVSIIGRHIFSDFLLPFEFISVLLLVALIGAIILARREQNI